MTNFDKTVYPEDEVIDITNNPVQFTAYKIKSAPFGTKKWFSKLVKNFFPQSKMIDMQDLSMLYLVLVTLAFYFSWIALGNPNIF